MRKYAILLTLLASAAPLASLSGCQMFTAGEKVSEPDPGQARAKASQQAHTKGEAHKAKAAPAEAAAPDTATAAHILIRYAGSMRASADITRSKEDAKKLAEQIAEKAKAPGADFAELANQYTEDPSGKTTGGRLGTFGRGRMVPEFDKATFELAPGGVSDVIETAFGFHIIYREK
jgi:parvulin-like peptidyl-prolyl isomerase